MKKTTNLKNNVDEKKQSDYRFPQLLLLFLFLGIVMLFFLKTLPISKAKVNEYLAEKITATQVTEQLEKNYAEKFVFKNSFVNLNGLMARGLGQDMLNDVLKLPNGHLTVIENKIDMTSRAENVAELDGFLKERGVGFLYISVPRKTAFYDVEIPAGYEDHTYTNMEQLLTFLQDHNVDLLDMNTWFAAEGLSMDEVYFRTDHHWKPETALLAMKGVMMHLVERYGIEYEMSMLDISNYQVDIYEDWFLGSRGKRVGVFYGGVDDIALLYPKYPHQITFSLPKYNIIKSGRLDETMLNYERIQPKDLFGLNPYAAYMGGDYPLIRFQNESAPNQMKILLLGDSFGNLMEYFLSQQFSDVYSIDLRHYISNSLAQYIDTIKPELVIACQGSYSSGLYSYGVKEYRTASKIAVKEIQQYPKIELKPKDNAHNFVRLRDHLEQGKTYTVTVDRTSVTAGETNYMQLRLFDFGTNKHLNEFPLLANSDEQQRWVFTVPKGEDISLLVYAGMFGKTKNIGVQLENVRIYEGMKFD